MGRFDVLTQLNKEPVSPSTPLQGHSRKPENRKEGLPENPKTSFPDFMKTRLPENQGSRKPENLKARNLEKAEKYSTQLQPSVIKKIKQYALEHDVKDYEVIQEAVNLYLDKKPENLKT
jgi:hypothetical protein